MNSRRSSTPASAGAPTCLAPRFALLLAVFLAGFQPLPAEAQRDRRGGDDEGLPLQAARTFEYTVSEGTWMSVDVSPDGRTLVFDHMGDLYLLPIEGGQARRLMGGLPFESQPRFSPEGDRIVFVSDRSGGENLWIVAVDGSDTTQVTKGNDNLYTSPEWTPDGRYLVASRTYSPLGGRAKLWLFHVEGGSGTALVREPENLKMLGAAFGADPSEIWYAERTGDWTYNALFPEYQLAVYDRETGQRTTMSSRYGSAFRPAFSPDGRWLTYGSRHDVETGLRLRDLETGEERWLAYPIQRDDQESRATLDVLPGYGFTPDSRAVVISYGGKLWRVPVEEGAVATEIAFTVDVMAEAGPRLDFDYPVVDSATFVVRQIRDPAPSPDGRQLAFTALDRLYVMPVAGGQPRALTAGAAGGEYAPVWSPDGQWVAYVSWDDRTGGHIWKVRASGGDPVRLSTAPAYYSQLAWSPAGDRLVAVRAAARQRREGGFGGPADFVWVAANGGAATEIAPTRGRGAPHFAGDPDRIYASSGRQGLVSFRWDGTDEREHLKVTGPTRQGADEPMNADVILMGPEGGQALAQVEDDLYLVTVPLVGGQTPTVSVNNPDNAAFPVTRLTDIGGQFPAWGADGRTVHWAIGNAHFTWDIAAARAFADSVRAARRAEGADAAAEPADADTADADTADGGPGRDEPRYRPIETRIRIEAPRDLPEGVAVLRGARVITMRGDEVLEDADILVRGNRIAAVGTRGSVEVPAGAEEVDVSGTTIVPGFVDTHAHLRPDFGIHTEQPWEYLANLAYGVTTTRDPQTSSTDVLTYADRVRTGELVGPRIYSTGPGVFGNYRGTPVRDLDHARDVLRRYSEYYDTKTFKMYLAGNRQQRQWLVMAARELGLMPTTEAGIDFALDMTHAVDGYPGIEHNLPIYPIYDDVVQLFARSGVVNTPTLIVSFGGPMGELWFYTREDVHDDPKLRRFTPHAEIDQRTRRRGGQTGEIGWALTEEFVFDDHARFLADVVAAGGCVGVGGHGQLQGLGYQWELWMVQSGGMSEHDALRAATICGAEAIGFEGSLGSIEPGKLADLVVLRENPLDDIRNTNTIRYVMKNGRLYEGDTLDEVWPRRRPLPTRHWVEEEPEVTAGAGR